MYGNRIIKYRGVKWNIIIIEFRGIEPIVIAEKKFGLPWFVEVNKMREYTAARNLLNPNNSAIGILL